MPRPSAESQLGTAPPRAAVEPAESEATHVAPTGPAAAKRELDVELEKLASEVGLNDAQRGAISSLLSRAVSVPARASRGGWSWTAVAPGLPDSGLPPHLEDLGRISGGGMGEVRRVRDLRLNRPMALKLIRNELLGSPDVVSRFIEEAQVSAQLQHPGIVPVHELGQLADGRLYFTMKEVRGRTLGEVIQEVHDASAGGEWREAPSGWTFRRLIEAFVRVCEAVGYAHARGIVHRDLKPANVMVGAFGEVLVLDWGLAKVLGRVEQASEEQVATHRSSDPASMTRVGVVAGTAAFMPPEQASGRIDLIDARSDVYALGAVLHELLSGSPPYRGESSREVLLQVLSGPPAPLPETLPAPLVALSRKAMAREPSDRPAHGGEVADEARAWLDGAHRREAALRVVASAEAARPRIRQLHEEAAALRSQAETELAAVPGWEDERLKAPAWALEERADALDREARLLDLQEESLLRASLTHAPELQEAHALLAARHREAHARAEATHDAYGVFRSQTLLEEDLAALPEAHPERVRSAAYLQGDGALSLQTDIEGAEVELHRYVLRNRRLVPEFVRSLGRTPLREVPLERGSYLCVLRHPERAESRYPVEIARGAHWDGVAPGESSPRVLRLPRPGELGEGERLVHPGWFWSGDPTALNGLPRERLWVDGFVMQRLPVTNAGYIAFLDALVREGREAEAIAFGPHERGASGEDGALVYGRTPEGGFVLQPDADGDVWDPEWPAILVHWGCANGYASWLAARTGLPWRLPGELEWEKAAGGVDGRRFPWGPHFDASWCNVREARAGRALPARVGAFPVDESPYGLQDLGGNMREWSADAFEVKGPPLAGRRVVQPLPPVDSAPGEAHRVIRGGSWFYPADHARVAYRDRFGPTDRVDDVGFRLARSWG